MFTLGPNGGHQLAHRTICLPQKRLVLEAVTATAVPELCPPCPTQTSLLAPDVPRGPCAGGRSAAPWRAWSPHQPRYGTLPQEEIPTGVVSEAKLCHQALRPPSPFWRGARGPPCCRQGLPPPHTGQDAHTSARPQRRRSGRPGGPSPECTERWNKPLLSAERTRRQRHGPGVAGAGTPRPARTPPPLPLSSGGDYPLLPSPSPPPAAGRPTGTHRPKALQRVGGRAAPPPPPPAGPPAPARQRCHPRAQGRDRSHSSSSPSQTTLPASRRGAWRAPGGQATRLGAGRQPWGRGAARPASTLASAGRWHRAGRRPNHPVTGAGPGSAGGRGAGAPPAAARLPARLPGGRCPGGATGTGDPLRGGTSRPWGPTRALPAPGCGRNAGGRALRLPRSAPHPDTSPPVPGTALPKRFGDAGTGRGGLRSHPPWPPTSPQSPVPGVPVGAARAGGHTKGDCPPLPPPGCAAGDGTGGDVGAAPAASPTDVPEEFLPAAGPGLSLLPLGPHGPRSHSPPRLGLAGRGGTWMRVTAPTPPRRAGTRDPTAGAPSGAAHRVSPRVPRPATGRRPLAGGRRGAHAGPRLAAPTLETMRGSPCSSPPRSVKPQGAPPCSCTCTYWGAPGRPSARSIAATAAATPPSRPGPARPRTAEEMTPPPARAERRGAERRGGAGPARHRGCSAAANEARGDGGNRLGTARLGRAGHG